MSEEILDALTQLFAMTTMQEGGTTAVEKQFVINYFNKVLDQASVDTYIQKYDEVAKKFNKGKNKKSTAEDEEKAFMKFSVRVLGMCKKINKTLTQEQKVVVLIKMLELVASDNNTSPRRMEVIQTAAAQLQLKDYYELIRDFVLKKSTELVVYDNTLTVGSEYVPILKNVKYIQVDNLQGKLVFLRVKDVDMYFVKYTGKDDVIMNGFSMNQNEIYIYTNGSIIKTSQGAAFYYSDITSFFISGFQKQKISFNARNLTYKFKSGDTGLRNVNISESAGKLVGIMGASGAGKTTLMNVLAGIDKPAEGYVQINGINIHEQKDKIEGVIGYVAQDDLLIEELTVFQNLYYNTKLCFKSLSDAEINERVDQTLINLNLDHIKHLKVGSVLDKTISGGQRKRLNIALELIREPSVLFLDEPTSGLSSKDSENVIDLLKELSLKGKLIFVVIHQPSSEIFKMFDKLIILDTGGYTAYYGNPVEAVVYFKKATNQVKSNEGQCFNCGNVNVEQIFDIIEDQVVDEYGHYTNKRKITPELWQKKFKENVEIKSVPEEKIAPPKALDLPNKIKQTILFTTRDFLSKISNKQYLLINLIEAPLLAMLLAFVIRFQNDPLTHEYTFRYNDNIPAYILICVIVSLFMGLTVSAEEIYKDKKIRKRESFLNLSRHSYLCSKLIILFSLSALQTLLFVSIGNFILEIQGMNIMYWAVLFSVSCFANVLGLNISSSFNSVVTIYITIPILLIPQLVLSGFIFNFNTLNKWVSDKGVVPVIADLMASRWAAEAISVEHFRTNKFQKPYFEYEKKESVADFKRSYWADEMHNILVRLQNHMDAPNDSISKIQKQDIALLRTEIIKESINTPKIPAKDVIKKLGRANLTEDVIEQVNDYLDRVSKHYRIKYNEANEARQLLMENNDAEPGYNLTEVKNDHYNESLSDLVKNANLRDKILPYQGQLLQQIDPIYNDPEASHILDYRTHFFASQKHFLNSYFNTYIFNIIVIWLMTIILYFTLYIDFFRRVFRLFGGLRINKKQRRK